MFFKKLFYASAAVLMLALAYHLGASTATAQNSGNPIVAVVTSNYQAGKMFAFAADGTVYQGTEGSDWSYRGQVSGAPVSTTRTTFGAVKLKGR